MLKEIIKALVIFVIQSILPKLMAAAEQKYALSQGEAKRKWVLGIITAMFRTVSEDVVGALVEGNMPEIWAAREPFK